MTDKQEPPDGSDPFDAYTDLSDLTGGGSLPPLEDPSVPVAVPPRSPLLTGLIVALLLIVLSIAIFQLLRDDSTEPAATSPVATTATTTHVTSDPSAPVTPTTSGTEPTAGGPGTTVAVSVPGTSEPFEAVGDAIPLGELTMKVDGIGPVSFGTSATEAIGRLISSLGEPDEDTGPFASTGAFGACEGKLVRIVRWGPFVTIVVVDDDGTATFGGYRLDFSYGDINHQATDLQTLSGLKAGQSVVALADIYDAFQVTYEVIPDLGTTFQLRSSNSGNLLLWGPVTSDDSNGIVLGIYAPDACGRFQ